MGEVKYVNCGHVKRAVGLKGECLVLWTSGSCPVEVGEEIFIHSKKTSKNTRYCVLAVHAHGRFCKVRFEGINDRSAAEKLSSSEIFLLAENLPKLSAGEYYCYQILGMSVKTEDGRKLGVVTRIFTAGENDVYEVTPHGGKKGGEILLPAIDEVIINVNVKTGEMTVRLLKGMIE